MNNSVANTRIRYEADTVDGLWDDGFHTTYPLAPEVVAEINYELENLNPADYGLTEPCQWQIEEYNSDGDISLGPAFLIDFTYYEPEFIPWLAVIIEKFFQNNPLNGLLTWRQETLSDHQLTGVRGAVKVVDNQIYLGKLEADYSKPWLFLDGREAERLVKAIMAFGVSKSAAVNIAKEVAPRFAELMDETRRFNLDTANEILAGIK